MALVTANSDIVSAFVNKQRIRTMNYHGSMTNTTILNGDSWASGDAGSTVYLTLVPFGAVLKSIKFSLNKATTTGSTDDLNFTIGIAGINPDRTFTSIKSDLITVAEAARAADSINEILPASLWGETLYQQLCSGSAPYTPIDNFKPYKDNEYGVLYFVTTEEMATATTTLRVSIDWVDPSPSETTKINKVINTINARTAA